MKDCKPAGWMPTMKLERVEKQREPVKPDFERGNWGAGLCVMCITPIICAQDKKCGITGGVSGAATFRRQQLIFPVRKDKPQEHHHDEVVEVH